MALITKAVRGTQDVLPEDSHRWQYLEQTLLKQAKNYGFKEMRTPVFENTVLFQRGVGETTDVVQKEMYTFKTKGDDSITLRPEGTAGAARAMLEHALYNQGLPIKICYLTSCYRYEKPQAGRLREFHQFGLEVYGAEAPQADAELIAMACGMFNKLGLKNVKLEINSIGCPSCRKDYHDALKSYFSEYKDQLCDTCLSRLEKNPMRILDCKSKICSSIAENAPKILDFLCDECNTHFERVKGYLDALDIEYTVNPKIVRGLDYYTKTVFEFITDELGSQGTICGGGRYDGLIEELGGRSMPSLGFAIGLERVLMLMDVQKAYFTPERPCEVFIAYIGENAKIKAFQLVQQLRNADIYAELSVSEKSLKAQMKYADKIGAKRTIVIGDDEIAQNKGVAKDMDTGETKEIDFSDICSVIN
ncbi:MAG: histidine--tRNA ligase [Acutalibacteraceae bacterium]